MPLMTLMTHARMRTRARAPRPQHLTAANGNHEWPSMRGPRPHARSGCQPGTRALFDSPLHEWLLRKAAYACPRDLLVRT